MACGAAKLGFQGTSNPIADGALRTTGRLPHSSDKTLGQLDREYLLGFGNSVRTRGLLGSLDVTRRLPRRCAKLLRQTRDDLGRRMSSVQKLKGLVHAPEVLGFGRPAQYVLRVLLYVTLVNAFFFPCRRWPAANKPPLAHGQYHRKL